MALLHELNSGEILPTASEERMPTEQTPELPADPFSPEALAKLRAELLAKERRAKRTRASAPGALAQALAEHHAFELELRAAIAKARNCSPPHQPSQ
jgi:hypothetical protein